MDGVDRGEESSYPCRSDGVAQELNAGATKQTLVKPEYEAVIMVTERPCGCASGRLSLDLEKMRMLSM